MSMNGGSVLDTLRGLRRVQELFLPLSKFTAIDLGGREGLL